MTEPWVSVKQITEHLGVTRDSIYRWIDKLAAFFERYFGLGCDDGRNCIPNRIVRL